MSLATSTPLHAIAFAAFATIAVAGCGINVTLDADTTSRVEHDTVPVGDLRMLDVSTENGAVEVRGGGGDEISVRTVMKEHHDGDADASVVVDGDRLVIDGECDGRWWNGCSVGFVVTVPTDFDVRVSTDNGRVDVQDVDGDVDVDTDNGAIEASRLGGDSVVTKTDNGRIRLTFDEAPTKVTAQTDNGSISLRLPDDADSYAVDADSDNGAVDVDLAIDPAAPHHVTARSDNGTIDIGYLTD